MASEKKKSVDDLIGRTMNDIDFAKRLIDAPKETLEAEGYEATPEVIEAITSANRDEFLGLVRFWDTEARRAAGLPVSAYESAMADRKAAF